MNKNYRQQWLYVHVGQKPATAHSRDRYMRLVV
jgi:hypothetical protein